jgi:hypothetical protein
LIAPRLVIVEKTCGIDPLRVIQHSLSFPARFSLPAGRAISCRGTGHLRSKDDGVPRTKSAAAVFPTVKSFSDYAVLQIFSHKQIVLLLGSWKT